MKCEPKNCYELNERLAIQQECGLANREATAIKDTCMNCSFRGDKKGFVIMKELRG